MFEDVGPISLWCCATFGLCAAVWRLVTRLFPHDSARQHVMHALIVGWAAIVFISIVAGAVHAISATVLFGGLLILSALLAGASSWIPTRTVAPSFVPTCECDAALMGPSAQIPWRAVLAF